MNLIFIFLIAGFIGGLSTLIPSLFLGTSNDGSSIEEKSGANLGYEEVIRVNIDKYGNLTVQGSFQGPQVTPNVDWSLSEYDYIYMLQLEVVNPNTRDYFYQRQTQVLNPALPINDVYLHILFLTDDTNPFVEEMANPVLLNPTQMQQAASIIKIDLERAFGISNNFSANPIGIAYFQSYTKIISYGFNFSTPVNYNYFIQFFQDHTPAGLADSFTPNRIRNTDSWLNWFYTNNWFPGLIEKVAALSRSPLGYYNTSFECNVFLQYPQFFGTDYPSTEETFNLSEVVDAPFIPLIDLTESAYSSSEIEIVVENGNITSDAISQYHIPRYQGLDHDWWLLRNTTLYNTQVTGLGNVSDIQISFTAPVIAMNILTPPPPPATVDGLVNIVVTTQTALAAPPWLFAEIFDEATFQKIMFDDFAYQYSVGYQPITFIMLGSVVEDIYMGVWNNSYRYPNGNYYIYIAGQITELSRRTPRSFFMGNVYNFSRFTLNNPLPSKLTVISPLGNQPLSKNVNISVTLTSPELICAVTYEIINHSQYFLPYILEPVPMVNGSLINRTTNWSALWDSTTVPSTHDYILRIKVTDANDTYFKDLPITVQNTLFQENVPLYAPMGGSDPNYDLNIGTIVTPSISDPTMGGGGGGPGAHAFFGYGVNFGMDFKSLLYRDVMGIFFVADNPHTTNPVWAMMADLPELDYGMSILMPDNSPATQLTADAIMHEAVVAFNIPTDLPFIGSYPLAMGMGMSVYFFVYGTDYSSITYGDFVDKFHLSVPSGLAALFTRENMTQSDLNSSLMFGWMNPTGPMGSMYAYSPYRNYDFGLSAFISPMIWIPNYFNNSLGAKNSFSLKALFPQIPKIKACAPTVASTVLSGFGPNFLGAPYGAIALNANITAWYPVDPFRVNVTPLYGYPIPSTLNLITFTLLNTEETPYGLRSTDDIRVNFTGPFITNNLLTPTPMQSIQLEDCNITAELQGLAGGWDRVQYDLRPVGSQQSFLYGDLHYNGQNWTQVISSTDLRFGAYQLNIYVRDTLSIWALNRTIFYVNNTARFTTLDIYINERGDVEIGFGIWDMGYPTLGYGINLGITPEVFNSTEIFSVEIYITPENAFNPMALYGSSSNWNVLVIINGMETTTKARLRELAGPMVADLERVFNISGMLHELVDFRGTFSYGFDRIAFAMNYTVGRDYNYFLDHYETVRSGNISNIVSKENLLRADDSYLSYNIFPDYFRELFGPPPNSDYGDTMSVSAWMRFEKVYDYSILNQTYQFSLAEFLGIHQINTDEERGMTFSDVEIYTHVACGRHMDVYPNHPTYTSYESIINDLDTYSYNFLYKYGDSISGLNSTDDIRFNFTAPYTSIQVLTPLPGSTIHGVVELRVNATMLQPATNDVTLSIYPAGAFMDPLSFLYLTNIKTIPLHYDPLERCWTGYWETLTDQVPNGWYDLIFLFEDAAGNFQKDCSRVYVYNTYYTETLGAVVEQDGNVSVSFSFNGNIIKGNLDYSLPEYQKIAMLSMMAFNAYAGHNNYSKKLLSLGFQFPECDYGVSVLFAPEYSPAEALSIAIPIKNDVERAFKLPGLLKYLQTSIMSIPTGAQPITLRVVSFGNNYSASLTYDYFIDLFHQQLPSGMSNSLTPNALKGTDSNLMWVLSMSGSFKQKDNPPSIAYAPLSLNAKLFYPHYVAGNFMSSTLTPHSLSLCDLLNIPQFFHASNNIADSMSSSVQIIVENANITRWYPDIPSVAERNSQNYFRVTLASANSYESWNNRFDNRIYSFPPWNDINITFVEPMTRPIFLTPLSGAVVDGIVTVSVLVQSAVNIGEVDLKIYSESEFNKLDVNKIIGGGSTMPYVRPEGLYGYQSMIDVGGGIYNYTWCAYQHPDGPIWLEVVVATEEGQFSFNSTRVIISRSNPLAINVLSPFNGQIVAGPIEIITQIVNSTPIFFAGCQIVDELAMESLWFATLEPQGGGIYSAHWGSQGVSNGTYLLEFFVADENFAFSFNMSVRIEVRNPFPIEITIIHPTDTLKWSDSARIEAIVTGPYNIMTMEYTIDSVYFSPDSQRWETYMGLWYGVMDDPESVWVGFYDSTMWGYKIPSYSGEWYDAYYQVTITASDTTNSVCLFSKRFKLELPAIQLAEIISPTDFDYPSGRFNVVVNTTTLGDHIGSLNGVLQRASDGVVVAKLNFMLFPNDTLGYAPIYGYVYPNDVYDIVIWGTTTLGTFYDSVRIQTWNPYYFSIEYVTPDFFDTLTGVANIQLRINNPFPLDVIQAQIYPDWSYNTILTLNSFVYNPLSGLWEQQLSTTELPDGNYRIECYVEDTNFEKIERTIHFSINNPPHVTVMTPLNGSVYVEYAPISIEVAIPDSDIKYVELWVNNTFIMEFIPQGINWVAVWSYTIGWAGIDYIQVRAYDFDGLVNDTEWIWVKITSYTPPAKHADLYKIATTNTAGEEQTVFLEGETVEYHSIIRGDAASSTYIVTAQTDDPFFQGYLQYNETVKVTAGQDMEVVFSFTIGLGAPAGKYTVQVLVWTNWPWKGGICVDFITITFEVI